jgi:hypothetical protein
MDFVLNYLDLQLQKLDVEDCLLKHSAKIHLREYFITVRKH